MNISVIIPLYNAERFIAKALDSCLQFAEVKEIIVIDDAYPDKAMEIVREYSEEHPIIKYFNHPNNENKGAGASRNWGITKATGDYIAFLDADDFFLPNRFDAEKELFKNENVDGVYGALGVYYYSQRAELLFNAKFPRSREPGYLTTISKKIAPEDLFETLLGLNNDVGGHFSLDALTLRANVLKQKSNLFAEHLKLHQDSEFLYRVAYFYRLHPGIIDQPIAMRGIHEENRITNSGNKAAVAQHRFLVFEQMCKWAEKNRIEKKYIDFFYNKKHYFELKKSSQLTKIKIYVKLMRSRKRFLKSSDVHVIMLHAQLFNNSFLKKAHMKILQIIR